MNAVQEVAREGLIDRWLSRRGLGGRPLSVIGNPTEEILEDAHRGRPLRLELFGSQQRRKANLVRKEENYLYSTRRFPLNTANNTIGAGAVAAQEYDFFGQGIGDSGTTHGYFSLSSLTPLQTNMDKGGKIPSGRGFAMFELAVSFNAQALGADIAQLLDVANLKYVKQGGAMTIEHGPIRNWPGGVGVAGYASAATTTINVERAGNGAPNLGSVRRFKQPRLLNANESFKYVVTAVANLPKSNTAVALSDFVEMSIWLFGWTYDRIPE
jgi:hypothetical protein